MNRHRILPESRRARIAAALFSLALAAVWVTGNNMHIVSPYDGRIDENYLLPWTAGDGLLLLGLAVLFFLLFSLALRLFAAKRGTLCRKELRLLRSAGFWAGFAALLLLWLPYLLRYYPGFVFPDTENSVLQALGLLPFNNRNPLLYTLFLRLCLRLGGAFSSRDLTGGFLLYSLLQMAALAAAIARLCAWVRERGCLSRVWHVLLILLFGLDPYVAALSVAMWKDPFFAAAVVLWSLQLADLVLEDAAAQTVGRCLRLFVLTLLVLFSRNNGFTAVLGVLAALLVLCLCRRRRGAGVLRPALRLTLCALLLWGIMVVPVYQYFGIGTPKEEMGGLMLNQMARVAASDDGVLSEDESRFLDEMLPLERYADAYRPCCVDMLKWDGDFHYEVLNGSRFLKTWLSLLQGNPRLYAEAWVLETYGFWTVNRPETITGTANISMGAPLNFKSEGSVEIEGYRLRVENRLPAFLQSLPLPADTPSLPLGPLNWLVLLLALLLILCGEGSLTLPLMPSLGIAAGMILGTPISYLPRYELPAQLLFPLFLLLFCRGTGGKEPGADIRNQ